MEDATGAVQEFVEASSVEEALRVIHRHTVLLTPVIDYSFAGQIQALQAFGYSVAPFLLALRLNTLKRSQEVGIARLTRQDWGASDQGWLQPLSLATANDRARQLAFKANSSSDPTDLNGAIEAWREVLHHPAIGDAPGNLRATHLNSLGEGLWGRFKTNGLRRDRDEARRLWLRAVKASPPSWYELPLYLLNLGEAIHEQYRRGRRHSCLLSEIRLLRRAEDLIRESTSPHWPETGPYSRQSLLFRCEEELGWALFSLYVEDRSRSELDQAIQAFNAAVQLAGSSVNGTTLGQLGLCLQERYRWSGDQRDLEAAHGILQRSLQLLPPGSELFYIDQSVLASVLTDKYIESSDIHELDTGLALARESLAGMQKHPERIGPAIADGLNSLGVGLREHFELYGDQRSLDEAIDTIRRAVNSPYQRSSLLLTANLAETLRVRYQATGSLENLEETVQLLKAVEGLPGPTLDRVAVLTILGECLRERARYRHGDDLSQAIDRGERALAETPPESTLRPSVLWNLACALGETRKPPDHKRAVQLLNEAFNGTPESSATR